MQQISHAAAAVYEAPVVGVNGGSDVVFFAEDGEEEGRHGVCAYVEDKCR